MDSKFFYFKSKLPCAMGGNIEFTTSGQVPGDGVETVKELVGKPSSYRNIVASSWRPNEIIHFPGDPNNPSDHTRSIFWFPNLDVNLFDKHIGDEHPYNIYHFHPDAALLAHIGGNSQDGSPLAVFRERRYSPEDFYHMVCIHLPWFNQLLENKGTLVLTICYAGKITTDGTTFAQRFANISGLNIIASDGIVYLGKTDPILYVENILADSPFIEFHPIFFRPWQ